MATVSAPQYNRMKNSSMNFILQSMEETTTPVRLPDLRQVTVLPKTDWLRIQDNLNHVNKHKENLLEASKERYDLHLRSKEVVKFWSNTIAGQRQKKLEAKKIREEIEEEEKKQIDLEEAEYQKQKRKEAIAKAKSQQYFQTDRVKGFHSSLLLTEVLKEREAQMELKQRKQMASKDVNRDIMAQLKQKDEEALEQERQRAVQRKQEREDVAEFLKQQIKEQEAIMEKEKLDKKKEADELQKLKELHGWERSMYEQKKQEEKRNVMRAHLEHLSNRNLIRAIEIQKQEAEDECRRLFSSAKQKMMKMRKEKEAEMFSEVQRHTEKMVERLATQLQEKTSNDEELIANAVTLREARLEREQRENEAKKKAMLDSITAHRAAVHQEQEQKIKEERQRALEMLQAKKESDKIFLEKQQLKAQKMKENCVALQDFHVHQMAERRAKEQLVKKEQLDFEVKNTELVAAEEQQFQKYAEEVINTATEAKRNTLPLRKAAREGIGGGLGPIFGGLRPSYLVHDSTGVELPKYVSYKTQDIKELYETNDIQLAKKRLGFSW
ncbi:coiled-coil domain-containing protein 173-like isoform X1 [Anguilla anguilla]|uniref:coiled-coil domain-containing protein 173-like isoform X1 n=2 Tax=Anguilla anguilla TaxID=7936 RepID=UPI0015A7E2C3|nr:coiled-coil domain-containing protein 173-like isoform X1 [Anguilla anguilla]